MMNDVIMGNATAAFEPEYLTSLFTWGLSVIHAFQSAGNPVITVIAKAIHLAAGPAFYILLIPAILWCIDEKFGFRLGLALFFSNGLNTGIKGIVQEPRPWFREPGINLISETNFSLPSGHAQNAAAFWPLFLFGRGVTACRKHFAFAPRLAIALLLPLLIGLSRIYLGVHYPTDVFAGWVLGALVSVVMLFAAPAILNAFNTAYGEKFRALKEQTGRSFRNVKIALAAIAAFALNAINGSDTSMGGALFGLALGYIFLADTSFSAASGTLAKKTARLALGLILLAGIYLGLKLLFAGFGQEYYSLCRFIRYGLVGFCASFGAPSLFIKLKLA